jgi:hypothetical protein
MDRTVPAGAAVLRVGLLLGRGAQILTLEFASQTLRFIEGLSGDADRSRCPENLATG